MKYYLKQKLVSLHHALKIFDGQDDVVYEVESKMFSLHDKTYLRDAAGNEVVYLHAKAFSLHEVHYVDMASGLSFEISTELFHLTKDIIRIDSLGWELHGDITSHDYQIIDEATHTILATVHRKFFSLHDVYEIEINDEQQRDVLMAAIIVLEHIHSQRDAARVGAAAGAGTAAVAASNAEKNDCSLSTKRQSAGCMRTETAKEGFCNDAARCGDGFSGGAWCLSGSSFGAAGAYHCRMVAPVSQSRAGRVACCHPCAEYPYAVSNLLETCVVLAVCFLCGSGWHVRLCVRPAAAADGACPCNACAYYSVWCNSYHNEFQAGQGIRPRCAVWHWACVFPHAVHYDTGFRCFQLCKCGPAQRAGNLKRAAKETLLCRKTTKAGFITP